MQRKLTIQTLAGALLAALAAGGCGGGKVTPVKDEGEFQQMVLASKAPVLVDFYKGGCPTCVALDPIMDELVDEYRGRAVIAKFMMMTAGFQVTSPELKQKYDIHFYPTVVLFIDGQEQKRWIIHYGTEDYRKALDQHVGPAPGKEEAAWEPWPEADDMERTATRAK